MSLTVVLDILFKSNVVGIESDLAAKVDLESSLIKYSGVLAEVLAQILIHKSSSCFTVVLDILFELDVVVFESNLAVEVVFESSLVEESDVLALPLLITALFFEMSRGLKTTKGLILSLFLKMPEKSFRDFFSLSIFAAESKKNN